MKTFHKKSLIFLVPALGLIFFTSAFSYGKTITTFSSNNPSLISDQEGYDRAYTNNITTQPKALANLTGSVRRYELAKMMSEFYTTVMGYAITPNPACDITLFSDYGTFNLEMKTYIKNICDMGIMGWNAKKTALLPSFQANMVLSAIDFNTIMIRYIRMARINYSFRLPKVVTRSDVFRFLYDMGKYQTPQQPGQGGVQNNALGQ